MIHHVAILYCTCFSSFLLGFPSQRIPFMSSRCSHKETGRGSLNLTNHQEPWQCSLDLSSALPDNKIIPLNKVRVRTRPNSADDECPKSCYCVFGPHTIDIVDCSNKNMTQIPNLPSAAKEIYLRNNKIQEISCISFKYLTKLRKLDLSKNMIGAVYNCSFDSLKSLENLWLSENHLTALPFEVFDSLHNLIHLDLSKNKINNLNLPVFSKMSKLRSLDLGKNSLTKARNNTFNGLSSLMFLSLHGNYLRYRPGTFESEAFQGMSSLESLDLQGNQPKLLNSFTYPDEALSRIPMLRNLWMDGYPHPLGPGFSSLVRLKFLSFARGDGGYCAMDSDIPPDFFNHLATKEPLHINFTSCSFKSIPPGLFKPIPNIYSLDLTFNDHLLIDGFEKASEGLRNSTLTILNISGIVNSRCIFNEVKNTSFRFLKHTKLKVLIVENCHLITFAPQAIMDLPETMEYLSVENNKLIDPRALASVIHLRNLKVISVSKQLSNNEISLGLSPHFPSTKHSLEESRKNATMFNISYNGIPVKQEPIRKFLQLPRHFYQPSSNIDIMHATTSDKENFCGQEKHQQFYLPLTKSLEEAYASDIKVTYNIPEVHFVTNTVLKIFDLSSNYISCFGGPIHGAPSLQHLDLSRNFCIKVNPLFFSHLAHLKTLLLYKNILGQALAKDVDGVTFSPLIALETLDLSSNVIEDIPEQTFKKNVNLRILNLSNNELTEFHPSLENNKKLEKLDLSSNLLQGLSKLTCDQLFDIKTASPNFTARIDRKQRFVCSCDYLIFIKFLLDQPEIFENLETFQCQLANGSRVSYVELPHVVAQLRVQCVAQFLFISVLIIFFLVIGSFTGCSLYHFKRWQWKYLYYVGKSRLHVGSTYENLLPAAQAFFTYDQVRLNKEGEENTGRIDVYR